ncbi:hypothetical protein Tco_0465885 [Tanacetum coccineum]
MWGKENGVKQFNVKLRKDHLRWGPREIIGAEGTEGSTQSRTYGDQCEDAFGRIGITKEDRKSQMYDDFEHFRQNKGETIHDYYVRFAKLINDMRNIKMTMSKIQLNSKFMNNMLPEWGRLLPLCSGLAGAQNRVGNANPGDNAMMRCGLSKRLGLSSFFVDNVFQAEIVCYDSDVDEAPTAQTMFMANLSSADPVYDEVGPSYDSDILSEVQDHDHFQDAICEHHEEHGMQDDVQPSYVVASHADYMSDSNMTPYDRYVKDNAVL